MKKRVIETLNDFEFEASMLPDAESEKEIIIKPKSALHQHFMEKAIEHGIDDAILGDY
jgi:hypothetical protein